MSLLAALSGHTVLMVAAVIIVINALLMLVGTPFIVF